MNLCVRSVTVREVGGNVGRFPKRIRDVICRAVETISQTEFQGLLAKKEADPENFDSRIEQNLRKLDPSLAIRPDCPVSPAVRFNSDLIIAAGDAEVCLEIEKGQTSRFELDVLKMQAFASHLKRKRPKRRCFGAFIVPMDNVVARHISGNSRESSYRYLSRLARLLLEIDPLVIEDILVLGYGLTAPASQGETRTRSTSRGKSIVRSESGLLPEGVIERQLRGCPTELVLYLRKRLAERCTVLREKLNVRQRYLGYATGPSDALYVYVQKQCLVLDIRLPAGRASEVVRRGFQVKRRDNYQAKAGWLTGVRVPHGTDKRDLLVELALDALQAE